ncbi:MAG: ribose 5-phosphate isomerase B [Candidatus Omnitrophota bacterium]
MTIFIGADHRGVGLKSRITVFLKSLGHSVEDVGAHDESPPCDYPPIAYDVASRTAADPQSRGILICMSGIGLTIAANKVPGAYAALCYNMESAKLSRQHNNANILVLGAKFVDPDQMNDLIKTWLEEPFEGGRHQRRLDKICEIERKIQKSEQ